MATTGQILGKAHKVVEQLNAGVDGVKLPFLARQVEHSIKWALPGMDEMPDPDPQILQGAPLHLPCQDVLLESDWEFVFEDGEEERGTAVGLLTEATPGVISGMWFGLTSRGLMFSAETRLSTDATGRIQIHAVPYAGMKSDRRTYEKTAAEHAGVTVSWLAALRCVNVQSIDNQPPEALNRKRLRQGKVPMFTYKTLHVAQKRAGCGRGEEDSGRTPPRLHFRRGHVRRLDSERLTWVQPCMVGDKARGMVEKAYALEAR